MKSNIDYNSLIFILIWLLMPLQNGISQSYNGMLMFQIEGKQFKKNNYNKNGFLIGSQLLNIGKIKKDTKGYSLEINTKIFNKKGGLKSENSLKYLCGKSQNGTIFMGVIPFVNTVSRDINITVLSNNFLYPPSFKNSDNIDVFSILVNYKTGFFGVNTQTFINISNRNVKMTTDGVYNLTGNIEIKTYVGKLNILTLNYTSNEIIDSETGIISQKYTENDGSYFTIEHID